MCLIYPIFKSYSVILKSMYNFLKKDIVLDWKKNLKKLLIHITCMTGISTVYSVNLVQCYFHI